MCIVILKTVCFGEGLLKVKVRAVNAFSTSDVDVDLKNILQACQNYSDRSPDDYDNTVCIQWAWSVHTFISTNIKSSMCTCLFLLQHNDFVSIHRQMQTTLMTWRWLLLRTLWSTTLRVSHWAQLGLNRYPAKDSHLIGNVVSATINSPLNIFLF